MSVSPEEVMRIAALARLELEDPARMAVELRSILEHMAVLGDAESESVLESEAGSVIREDVVTVAPGMVQPESLSAHASSAFFTVPRLSAMDSA